MQLIMFTMLSIILFFTPSASGLYFDSDFYPIEVIILFGFFLFSIILLIKKETDVLRPVLFILLLPLCYLLSFPFAESPKGSIDMLIRWVTYASFFLLLFWTAKDSKVKGYLPVIFQFTGIWIALAMILDYYNWYEIQNSMVNERFSGFFEYPNTFSMVISVFYLFSLVMLTKDRLTSLSICLYAFPLVGFISNILQAYSRGIFLVLPIIWFIGLVLLKTSQQVQYLLFTGVSTVLSLVAYQAMINDEVGKQEYSGIWMFLIMTILTTALIIITINLFQKKFMDQVWLKLNQKRAIRFSLPLLLLLFAIAGVLDVTNKGFVYQQLPSKLQERVGDINFEENSTTERVYFLQDAMKMSMDSPLFGFGGNGWGTIYKKYQEIPYQSSKVHNGYLEWLINTGWIGLAIFIGVLIYLYTKIIKNYLSLENPTLQIASIVGSAIILIHSFMDFNFTFGTVWFLALWLFVIGLNPDTVKTKKQKIKKFRMVWCVVPTSLLVLICLILSFRFMQAEQLFAKGAAAPSITERKAILERIITLDPYQTKYWLELGNLYTLEIQQGKNQTSQLMALIKQVEDLEPNNPNVLINSATFLEKINQYEQAISYYDRALEVDHYNTSLYEKSIKLKVDVATKSGGINEKLLQSALQDFERNKQWLKKYEQTSPNTDLSNRRNFTVSEQTRYYGALIYFHLNDYENSLKILNSITPKEQKLMANVMTLKMMIQQRMGS